MRKKIFAEIPKKSIAAYRAAPVSFCSFQYARAHTALTKPAPASRRR